MSNIKTNFIVPHKQELEKFIAMSDYVSTFLVELEKWFLSFPAYRPGSILEVTPIFKVTAIDPTDNDNIDMEYTNHIKVKFSLFSIQSVELIFYPWSYSVSAQMKYRDVWLTLSYQLTKDN